MKHHTYFSLLFLLTAVTPQLRAQADTIPPIGGIVLDDDTFATVGDPRDVNRSSTPGSKKSLLDKASITVLDQGCELSCGSCAVTGAVMWRRKIYCGAQCKCDLAEVFSWSYLHNQLVKIYGRDNIRLKNVLDSLVAQGIPLALPPKPGIPFTDSFPNTPCSHTRLPEVKHITHAGQYRYWTYEPIFTAKKKFPGTLEQKEALFRKQLVPNTIAWVDQNVPVIVGLLVTENFRHLTPKDCVWEAPDPLAGAKGHAFLVMGYDDSAAEFTVLNSYGTGWGCGGLARISYADFTRTVQEGYVLIFNFKKKVECPGKK